MDQSSESVVRMDQLHGQNETLYIKCLFRTVTFHELKSELISRGMKMNNDSYYTMTLKLRLSILETENCYQAIQAQIKAELALVKEENRTGYKCSVPGCNYCSINYKCLIKHIKAVHGSTKQHLVCQSGGCTRVLSSLKMLLLHIRTSHQLANRSSVRLKQNQLTEEMSSLKCRLTSCSHQKFKTVKDLKNHLTSVHTDKMQAVECIFCDCSFSADRTGTLRSHFSRKHPIQQVHNLKAEVVEHVDSCDSTNFQVLDQVDAESTGLEISFDLDTTETFDDFEEEEIENEVDSQVLFTRALCIQFNNWSNVQNIANSTVNLKVGEVFNSYQRGVEVTKTKISRLLESEGMTE